MTSLSSKKLVQKNTFLNSEFSEKYVHDVEERAYISRKMSKIKWKPEGIDEYSSYFLTGSYDHPDKNRVELWSYSSREDTVITCSDFAPTLLAGISVDSNVTGIRFVDEKSLFAYSSYHSSVGLIKISNDPSLEVLHSWNHEDWFGSGKVLCCGLDCYDSRLAVGSLDGRICLMNPESPKNVGTICESTIPVHGLCFVGKDELVSTSMLGTISLWDLRSANSTPINCVPLSRSERVGVTCVTNFPTEKHMLVCGGSNGAITVFDLRNLPIPVRVFQACSSPVAELRFHPTRSSILFSCSSDGEIWQWTNFFHLFDPIRNNDLETTNMGQETMFDKSVLLDYKNVKPQVKCLLKNNKFSTTCIDLNKDRLICGTDNECVLAIKSLQLN